MPDARLWPKALDYYSALIGRNKALTQGPGGNTSLKSGDLIWVKASGLNLADAEAIPIFCQINKANPTVSLSDSNLRPSIEAYLHALIPYSVVYHVHSVGSISLAIRRKLTERQLLMLDASKLGYVGYWKPGEQLGTQIKRLIEENPGLQGALLKNHGIVLWGEELKILYETLLSIEREICKALEIDTSTDISHEDFEKLKGVGFLTPDHAVFSSLISSKDLQPRNMWIKDLVWCLALAVKSIRKGEEVESLNPKDVEELVNWDLEEERKRIQK